MGASFRGCEPADAVERHRGSESRSDNNSSDAFRESYLCVGLSRVIDEISLGRRAVPCQGGGVVRGGHSDTGRSEMGISECYVAQVLVGIEIESLGVVYISVFRNGHCGLVRDNHVAERESAVGIGGSCQVGISCEGNISFFDGVSVGGKNPAADRVDGKLLDSDCGRGIFVADGYLRGFAVFIAEHFCLNRELAVRNEVETERAVGTRFCRGADFGNGDFGAFNRVVAGVGDEAGHGGASRSHHERHAAVAAAACKALCEVELIGVITIADSAVAGERTRVVGL